MIFETHAHYDDEKFDTDRVELLSGMRENGIGRIINVGAAFRGVVDSVNLAKAYEDVYAAVGLHPSNVADFLSYGYSEDVDRLIHKDEEQKERYPSDLSPEELALLMQDTNEEGQNGALKLLYEYSACHKTVAIGEIGLDYYWDKDPAVQEVQRFWFRRQLRMAKEVKLPVIIHSRDAARDTMEIMKEAADMGISGVIHCYSYSAEQAVEYVKMGYAIGVGGVITFKNGRKLRETVEAVPMDHILLETDSPYLAPEPYRGQRNCSLYLHQIAERIAEVKGITPEEVEKITWDNACRLFQKAV